MKPAIKIALFVAIFLLGCATDQLSKNWAAHNLKDRPTLTAIPNVLELGYTENHGMVFGINNKTENGKSKSVLLIVRILLSIGLVTYILYYRQKPVHFHLPFLLILSGAIGNVIDSLRFGHVIDFIHMHAGKFLDWPFLYNLADAYVCIGMVILVIQSFFTDKKQSPATVPPPPPTT